MNHPSDLRPPSRDLGDGRVQLLLRRGGVVEQPPPPHVWEALMAALDADPPLRRPWSGSRRRARSTRATPALAAAAVGALLAWAGLALVGPDTPDDVLASGPLEALTADGVRGSAEVVDVQGHPRLRVSLDGTPDAGDGYLEVWLLRPDVSGMVTLGVLDGPSGEFLLPEGLDLAEYAVVDISREHLDGDPGHGGDSLVRGQVG